MAWRRRLDTAGASDRSAWLSAASSLRDSPASAPAFAAALREAGSFYLPNAASVAEGWRTLETRTSASATERMTQARDVMKSLTAAFDQYADAVAEPELQSLDLDLKILKDALKADQKSLT